MKTANKIIELRETEIQTLKETVLMGTSAYINLLSQLVQTNMSIMLEAYETGDRCSGIIISVGKTDTSFGDNFTPILNLTFTSPRIGVGSVYPIQYQLPEITPVLAADGLSPQLSDRSVTIQITRRMLRAAYHSGVSEMFNTNDVTAVITRLFTKICAALTSVCGPNTFTQPIPKCLAISDAVPVVHYMVGLGTSTYDSFQSVYIEKLSPSWSNGNEYIGAFATTSDGNGIELLAYTLSAHRAELVDAMGKLIDQHPHIKLLLDIDAPFIAPNDTVAHETDVLLAALQKFIDRRAPNRLNAVASKIGGCVFLAPDGDRTSDVVNANVCKHGVAIAYKHFDTGRIDLFAEALFTGGKEGSIYPLRLFCKKPDSTCHKTDILSWSDLIKELESIYSMENIRFPISDYSTKTDGNAPLDYLLSLLLTDDMKMKEVPLSGTAPLGTTKTTTKLLGNYYEEGLTSDSLLNLLVTDKVNLKEVPLSGTTEAMSFPTQPLPILGSTPPGARKRLLQTTEVQPVNIDPVYPAMDTVEKHFYSIFPGVTAEDVTFTWIWSWEEDVIRDDGNVEIQLSTKYCKCTVTVTKNDLMESPLTLCDELIEFLQNSLPLNQIPVTDSAMMQLMFTYSEVSVPNIAAIYPVQKMQA